MSGSPAANRSRVALHALQTRALRLRKALAARLKRIALRGDTFKGRQWPRIAASPDRGHRMGLVCIVKNERDYIGEWLQFHILQGVTDVVIYDNGCTDDTLSEAKRHAASTNITVVPWRTFIDADNLPFSIQSLAYAHAIVNFGPALRWMAFIDVDEFLFAPSGRSLPDILNELRLPAIAVPWTNFGTGGHKAKPPGLVIESYTECAAHPLHPGQRSLLRYKSVVDPVEVCAMGSHIFPLHEKGAVAINERGEVVPVYNVTDPTFVSTKVLRLNHYFTRSEEEIANRIAKGRVSRNGEVVKNYLDRRLNVYSLQTDRDEAILQFVPELKRRLSEIKATE